MGLMDKTCTLLLGYMIFNGAASQPAAIDWLRRKIVGHILLLHLQDTHGGCTKDYTRVLRFYDIHDISFSVLFDKPPTL